MHHVKFFPLREFLISVFLGLPSGAVTQWKHMDRPFPKPDHQLKRCKEKKVFCKAQNAFIIETLNKLAIEGNIQT